MKKIIIVIYLLIISSLNITFSYSGETNSGEILSNTGILTEVNTGIIDETQNKQKKESLNKVIIDTINDKFNVNDELNQNIDEINKDIIGKDLELDAITTLVDDLKKDISTYKSNIIKLDEKNKEISSLTINNYEQEQKIKENNKIIELLNAKINDYESLLESYKSRIYDINIERNEKEILLKNNISLKNELDNKKKNELELKYFQLIMITLGVVIIYLVLNIYYFISHKKNKKERENIIIKKAYLNISITIFIVILSIFAYFYLHPEYLIYLIFFASAFIVVFRNFIISFFGAILNLSKYSIGQIVEIKGKDIKGKITGIRLFYIELLLIDEKNNYLNEKIKVPNDNFITYNISVINNNIVNDSIELEIDNDNYNIIEEIQEYLNNNLSYSIMNLGYLKNDKFDKKIIINEGKNKVKFFWNDTYHKNLEIKDYILNLILKYDKIKKEKIELEKDEGSKE